MALPNNIRAILVLEGLVNVDKFDDIKESQLNKYFKKTCTDITGIPAVAAAGGAVVFPVVPPVPPVLVSGKCVLCLKVASIVYHYYVSIVRAATPEMMNYTNVLKGFNIEYESLISLYKETKPAVTLLSKKPNTAKID